MNVVLVMFRENGERRSFSLSRDVTVVGRREDADFRIPLTDVSRKHCRLIKDGNILLLEDLGSSNGTYHNGNRVQEAEVQPGDTIRIGPVQFLVQIDGVPADHDMGASGSGLADSSATIVTPSLAMPSPPPLPPGFETPVSEINQPTLDELPAELEELEEVEPEAELESEDYVDFTFASAEESAPAEEDEVVLEEIPDTELSPTRPAAPAPIPHVEPEPEPEQLEAAEFEAEPAEPEQAAEEPSEIAGEPGESAFNFIHDAGEGEAEDDLLIDFDLDDPKH